MASFSFPVNCTTDGAFALSVTEGPAPVGPSEPAFAGGATSGLPSDPRFAVPVKTG